VRNLTPRAPRSQRTARGRTGVRDLTFVGPLGALGVMHVPTFTAEDAERAEGCKGKNRGSGSDVCRSSWRSWRALRDAVNPNPRSDSHAKSAKVAEDGRIPVASHSGLRRECHALLYEGARSVLTKERNAPIVCDVHVSGNDRRERRRGHVDVGGKLRRYKGRVRSVRRRRAASPSNRRTATAADAAQVFLGAIPPRSPAGGLRCQHHSETGQTRAR